MNHRPDRVSGLIQGELGKLILKHLEFPGVLVTITEVKVDKKMDAAEVKVGIVPQDKAEGTLRALKAWQSQLQFLLHRTLNIRPMPRIEFVVDQGAENAAKVEKILLEAPLEEAKEE